MSDENEEWNIIKDKTGIANPKRGFEKLKIANRKTENQESEITKSQNTNQETKNTYPKIQTGNPKYENRKMEIPLDPVLLELWDIKAKELTFKAHRDNERHVNGQPITYTMEDMVNMKIQEVMADLATEMEEILKYYYDREVNTNKDE